MKRKVNSFSKIVCYILLFTAVILPINVQAGEPGKAGPAQDYNVLKKEIQQLDQKIKNNHTTINTQLNNVKDDLKKINTQRNNAKDDLNKINTQLNNAKDDLKNEIKDLKKQKKDSTAIIAISCAASGVLFICFIVHLCVLIARTKKDKEQLSTKDLETFLSKQNIFLQKQEEALINQILQKMPSEHGISTSVVEQLKGQFENLRKIITTPTASKNETEILETLKNIKTTMLGELSTLRSQVSNAHQQEIQCTQKIADADRKLSEANRKTAEAQKVIQNCEADKARAVNAAKTEMQTSMLTQFAAEKAEINKTVKQQINAVAQQTERIEKLTTENSGLRSQAAEAEAKGYERGLKASQEKTEALVRNSEHLSLELNQERAKNEKAEADFKQKLSSALLDKDKECQQTLITSQNNIRVALGKQYTGEIERLNAALTEKTNSLSLLAQQKNASDQKIQDLQGQVLQAKTAMANEQKKTQDADARAREATQKANAMQATIMTVAKEKEALEGTIINYKTSIEKLTKDKELKEASLQAAEKKINELQSVIYPSEFIDDPDFYVLKEHLDSWIAEKISAAEIIKSALGLFSQKTAVNPETWQQALRNISVGITQVMREKKQSPNAILAELVLWSKFLMKFSDENYDFSLKIPNIGDNVDPSWMSPKNNKTTKVNAVLTWAVWNNQFGVMHNAEVE